MHDGGIDRHPLDVGMRSKRSDESPETAARAPTRMPCLRERRRSARLPPRCDAEQYVHTVCDLMFSIGDVEVGIGRSFMSPQWPKWSIFAQR